MKNKFQYFNNKKKQNKMIKSIKFNKIINLKYKMNKKEKTVAK